MKSAPSSWASSIVSLAVAVLVVCVVLSWAAQLLREALPVLLPASLVLLLAWAGWRVYRRSDRW